MTEAEEQDVVLKLLHTADWHLGKSFPQFEPADQQKLTRARLAAVDRLVGTANRLGVHAMLCAGDLFDEPNPPATWWQGLLKSLEKARDYPVFLLPGNHDPLMPGSVYSPEHAFVRGLPDNVHVVDSDDFTHTLGDDAVLYARPCRSQAGSSDLALGLPNRDPGDTRIRVGMVHGQTFDIDGHQTNFPIAKDAAVQRGLDYLAVGDTHSFREVPPGAEIPTVYPSAPEPTSFGEPDAGYAALVFFGRRNRRARVERQKIAHWQWRRDNCTTLAQLQQVLDLPNLDSVVMRLQLDMQLSPADFQRAETLIQQLKGTEASHGRVGVLQVERDGLGLDCSNVGADFEQAPEVLKAALQRLQAMEADEPDKARRAIYHLYQLVRAQA